MGVGALRACNTVLDTCDNHQSSLVVLDTRHGVRGSTLTLRVEASSIRESSGAFMHDLKLTDEFCVEALDVPTGLDPLGWRYDSETFRQHAWSQGSRMKVPMRYVRAKVRGSWYVLAAAVQPEDRTMENVVQGIEAAKEAAGYADGFNAHILRSSTDDPEASCMAADEVPKIRVCAPVGCRVLSSGLNQLAQPGAVVMLIPYVWDEVQKYVFDGGDEFVEVPHAFVHYVIWKSGGQACASDVQGMERQDGEFVLVDPFMYVSPKRSLFSQAADQVDCSPAQQCFDTLHQRCGPLCRCFDPQRRGGRHRKVCGYGLPSCSIAP